MHIRGSFVAIRPRFLASYPSHTKIGMTSGYWLLKCLLSDLSHCSTTQVMTLIRRATRKCHNVSDPRSLLYWIIGALVTLFRRMSSFSKGKGKLFESSSPTSSNHIAHDACTKISSDGQQSTSAYENLEVSPLDPWLFEPTYFRFFLLRLLR